MTASPGPDQSRDTPGARRPRELTLIEALRAQRLLNKRARQRVDGTAFVVWTMLLDSTLGFQQVRASHFHAYLAAEANTTSKTVRPRLRSQQPLHVARRCKPKTSSTRTRQRRLKTRRTRNWIFLFAMSA